MRQPQKNNWEVIFLNFNKKSNAIFKIWLMKRTWLISSTILMNHLIYKIMLF